MTRLESMLRREPLFPEDVKLLREEIPELGPATDLNIENFYITFSEWFFDSGWVALYPESISAFAGWLREDISE